MTMEEREARVAAIRKHLAEGAEQATKGMFVEDYSIERLLASLDEIDPEAGWV